MVIVTLRLLIVLQTVPSTSLEVTLTFTNYINPVVLDATLKKKQLIGYKKIRI